MDCRHVLPSPHLNHQFQNPARCLLALASGFQEAVNSIYREPVNIGGSKAIRTAAMTKKRRETPVSSRGSIVKCAGARQGVKDQSRQTYLQRNGRALFSFAEMRQATEQIFAVASIRHNPMFEKSTHYKFCKSTSLALQTTSDAEHIQLVLLDKAFMRAALVIEKELWQKERQVMIWTEFPEDEGMTIDYLECRPALQRLGRKRWILTCCDQDQGLSRLSKQVSEHFLSYLNQHFK